MRPVLSSPSHTHPNLFFCILVPAWPLESIHSCLWKPLIGHWHESLGHEFELLEWSILTAESSQQTTNHFSFSKCKINPRQSFYENLFIISSLETRKKKTFFLSSTITFNGKCSEAKKAIFFIKMRQKYSWKWSQWISVLCQNIVKVEFDFTRTAKQREEESNKILKLIIRHAGCCRWSDRIGSYPMIWLCT